MQDGEKLSLEQIRAFLEASDAVRFEARHRDATLQRAIASFRLRQSRQYREQKISIRAALFMSSFLSRAGWKRR